MKKFLIIILLLLGTSFHVTYSQFEFYNPEAYLTQHKAGDKIFSVSPSVLFNNPGGVKFAGGLKFQVFLSKRISVDADLVFGRAYYHLGPGVIGVPVGLIALNSGDNSEESSSSLSDFLFYAAAIALSFEHLSYHIPLKGNLDISPFISLLRYRSSYEKNNGSDPDTSDDQLSFATGVQVNKYFGRFMVSPYAEYNVGYQNHTSTYNIGVYCGIYFPLKQ